MAESLDSILKELDALRKDFDAALEQANNAQSLEEVRIRFLGRKGLLAEYFKKMGTVSAEEKPKLGETLNSLKGECQEALERARQTLDVVEAKDGEAIDLTLPLMETEYYNFEALNIPDDHPSKDLQDTFYLEDGLLLRTHTSPVQIRTMEKQKPPVRIIAPGRCFRKDTPDATHSPEFHQVEGLVVDKGITFAHLKGTLLAFAQKLFGPGIQVRFRPSFFPFTEPSAEYDFSCVNCGGHGCRVCKYSGWLEISGAGMVDPAVFGYVGYDDEAYTGFAWGMGVERIAMTKYQIDDIRHFYENDFRFLKQF